MFIIRALHHKFFLTTLVRYRHIHHLVVAPTKILIDPNDEETNQKN